MAHILWVEDQGHWVKKFSPVLQKNVFDGRPTRLEVFKFAEAALQNIKQRSSEDAPDVALLDASMNGNERAGFSVSRALHDKWPQVPIIYLSEHSGTSIEQGAFEECGAQDFIAKHQRNVEEVLCWRIRSVLRQSAMQGTNPGDVIRQGKLSIDLNSWEVYWDNVKLMNPANPKRPLAPTPRKILRYLVEASPRPINTDQMAYQLNNNSENFSYAGYRQHIRILRQSFDLAESGSGDFLAQCKAGRYLVTFGDEGAYCWKS